MRTPEIKGTEISSAIPLTKVSNALVTLNSLVAYTHDARAHRAAHKGDADGQA